MERRKCDTTGVPSLRLFLNRTSSAIADFFVAVIANRGTTLPRPAPSRRTPATPRGPPTADTKAYEPVDAHTAWPAGAWMEGSLEEGLSDILFRIVGLWRPALLYHGQSAQCRRIQTHCHAHRAVDTARKYEVHHACRAASDRVAASDAGDRFAWRASVRRHSVFWIQGKCLG